VEAYLEMEIEERAGLVGCGVGRYSLQPLQDNDSDSRLPPAPHYGVALLLNGSLKACHLPLPAGREVAGIKL
jgi:hypothetical protein